MLYWAQGLSFACSWFVGNGGMEANMETITAVWIRWRLPGIHFFTPGGFVAWTFMGEREYLDNPRPTVRTLLQSHDHQS